MFDVICKKRFVLLTDDSEKDSFFTERALRESARFQAIASVSNGAETIAYLSGRGQYADRQLWPFPDCLLFHLKKRAAEIFDVLEWLQRGSFADLKVAVLWDCRITREIHALGAAGTDAFCAGAPHCAELKSLVAGLEKLLLASGPNGEVALAPFLKN